jgi:hypothetical protein
MAKFKLGDEIFWKDITLKILGVGQKNYFILQHLSEDTRKIEMIDSRYKLKKTEAKSFKKIPEKSLEQQEYCIKTFGYPMDQYTLKNNCYIHKNGR